MPATAESDSLTPIGYVTENEMPDSVRVQDFDLDRDEEEFFAQGLEHGGTVLVVDMPRRSEQQVEQILKRAGAKRFAKA